MFPNPLSSHVYGTSRLSGQRLPEADGVEYLIVPTNLDPEPKAIFDSIRTDFDVVYEDDNVTLVKRKPGPG